jgi:hypothetical protein
VSKTPLSKYETAVTLDLIFQSLLLPLKGIFIEKNIHRQTVLHYFYNFHTKNMGLTRDSFCHSGGNDTAVTKIGDFVVDFLRELESIFKKALTRELGA